MIIDNLNTLPTPVQSTDEIPVERGTSTYKMPYSVIKDSIAQSTANLISTFTVDISGTVIDIQDGSLYYKAIDISSQLGQKWILSVGWSNDSIYDGNYNVIFTHKKIVLYSASAMTVRQNRALQVYAV